jgi:serine/threonine protein kinase
MADILKKFGRFFLLDQIAQGGMAEIYRARLASVDGAGRLIVIKRIQAGFGTNNEFLQMFKSEIKVTMGFNHPNIVQLYDFGEEAGQPFIAMELVDGKNLRQYMNRFSELKQTFPASLAAYIVEEAASALHYAHAFKDKITGHHLSIVHRDISPQNILISYEGNVKVIDFGIAKATTNLESTRAGVIKGKPSYLSPEQIAGEAVDGRSDLFALGIVLWELLVGRKLFAGDNELAVLKLIESSQTHIKPPSTFNPSVPKELDVIVMKTLAKRKENRYQSAEELQRALHRFLYATYPDFNPADLAYCAKDLFKNEIVEDRKRIQRLNEEIEKKLAASELVNHHESMVFEDKDKTPGDHTTTVVERRAPAAPAAVPPIKVSPTVPQRHRNGERNGERNSDRAAPAGQTAQSAQIAQVAQVSQRERPEKRSLELKELESSNPMSIKKLAPLLPFKLKELKLSGLKPFLSGLAVVLSLAFIGPDFGFSVPVLTHLMRENGRFPDAVSKPVPADGSSGTTDSGGMVTLLLNITPVGHAGVVKVNGHIVDMSTQTRWRLPGVRVSADSRVELSIESPDPAFRPVTREFVIDSTQLTANREYTLDFPLEPAQSGELTIRTTPGADALVMDSMGKVVWKGRSPFEKHNFPVGNYTVKLTNDLLDMERIVSVEIKDGQLSWPADDNTSREVKLLPAEH